MHFSHLCHIVLLTLPLLAGCSWAIRVPGASERQVVRAPLVITSTGLPPTVTLSPLPPTPTKTWTPETTASPIALPSVTPTAAAALKITQTISEETRGTITVRIATISRRYSISGYSQIDLEAQMRSLGPTDIASGSHWYALTEPTFDWDYEPSCAEQGCGTGPVVILLTVRYTLPEWITAEGGDQALRDQWAAFSAALTLHEQGHGDRAVACAWRLGEAFAALASAATVDDLDWSVRVASDSVFANCREEQSRYENETDHGRTQGVVWGP
jgi:predicted secreted Zn-dependent protease